jgi:hypothetical protein
MMPTTVTFNRGRLLKLARAGKLISAADSLPVNVIASKADRKSGHYDIFDSEFASGSGAAWQDEAGLITLYVHSSCSHYFRIIEG